MAQTLTATRQDLTNRIARRCGYGAQIGNLPQSFADLVADHLTQAQRWVWREVPPLATVTRTKVAVSSQQALVDYPVDCDPFRERLRILVLDSGTFYLLRQGIPDYVDPDNPDVGLPTRFERGTQLRIWPSPPAATTIAFDYIPTLPRFTSPSDRSVVNEDALFLRALWSVKNDKGQADAPAIAEELNDVMMELRAASWRGPTRSRSGNTSASGTIIVTEYDGIAPVVPAARP